MKRRIISLLLTTCFILTPINITAEETESITEEVMDYDTLKAEYDSLKNRFETFRKAWAVLVLNESTAAEEYSALEDKYNTLAAAYESLQQDYDDLKNKYEESIFETEVPNNADVEIEQPNPSSDTPLKISNTEILFRNIPWGTNYADVQQLLPDFDWSDMSFEHMRQFPVEEILTDDYDYYSFDFTNGGINMMATPFTDKETDVAGYVTSDIKIFFAYIPVNGSLSKDDSDTALYGARYEFEPRDSGSMAADLIDKLSSLYGDPDDVNSETDLWGNKITITEWRGANDTIVAMRVLDSSGDTTNIYVDELWISYAWERGDELLREADEAVSAATAAEEAANYGSGNTDGL